jgi:hypothetical protein
VSRSIRLASLTGLTLSGIKPDELGEVDAEIGEAGTEKRELRGVRVDVEIGEAGAEKRELVRERVDIVGDKSKGESTSRVSSRWATASHNKSAVGLFFGSFAQHCTARSHMASVSWGEQPSFSSSGRSGRTSFRTTSSTN